MFKIMMVSAVALLAACGSSGGAGGQDRVTSAADLAESLAQENVSDPGTLPTRGGATYTGFMTLALPIDGAVSDRVGDLRMAVDFGARRKQISGTASNFEGLTGKLDIKGGDLVRSADADVDFTFGGDVTGALGQGGDTYTIDGELAGEFRGRNQDGLTGLIYGDIEGPDGQDLFQGSMAATRDE